MMRREIRMKPCTLMGAMENGANLPRPRFIHASFERVRKVIVNKATDCVRENCVRKRSASPGTFDEKKPKVAAKRSRPRPNRLSDRVERAKRSQKSGARAGCQDQGDQAGEGAFGTRSFQCVGHIRRHAF